MIFNILLNAIPIFYMNDNELFHLLALLRVDGVGELTAKKLLHHFENAEAVFRAKPTDFSTHQRLGKTFLKKLQNPSVFTRAKAELDFIKANNIKVHYYQDGDYPQRLKHCIDGPVLLFSSGHINWNTQRVISIVGTRQITAYGSDFCRRLITDLAPFDPIIVSGFAYGVDIVAHLAAMNNNLQTIGILAHGLNQVYPAAHKKHVAKMQENGGFMSEFMSDSFPDKMNFVKRNRIVAGISQATVVVESAEKGGSLITANLANDYDREVFAVPGRTSDRLSAGCNNLIKTQRAHLLTSAADLVYMLGWEIEKSRKNETVVQKQLFVSLDPDEQKVYDYLNGNGKQLFDTIAFDCGFPVYKMASVLLNMELKGVVRPLPGKLFEVV